ncbi:alpha/beta fold hydrolase [Halalkalibacter akibai]|uniref:Abhydrolase n=1 Tax=Halalkalibacter akibai (strain ATCC 43226 / DSM 21942 / CIP 109018 / JCM 9157 / 1139) TaxID=1236973 RepID=W4QPN8_HALA3|nr:alpha/beta hydrolase [Halalkalibacter akibai]GAE33309.1 abhydrolase [Halalkalibacter akibai JCM 9157]
MYYKEYGETNSALMVFIHGGGVSGWMWDKQIEYFSSKFHCLVPEMPEHGRSKNGVQFTICDAASELNELIKEKGKGKRVIAIGFSLGAQVLIAMLSQKPNLIDFAMINSALVKKVPFANTLTKSMMFAFPLVKLKTFSKIQAKSMYINGDYQDIYYLESCRMNKDAFIRIMNENMSFKIPKNFKDSSSKILVTAGEKERKIMKDSMKEIMESNSNCKGLIVASIGHGFPLAMPKLFNATLEEWIENDVIIANQTNSYTILD